MNHNAVARILQRVKKELSFSSSGQLLSKIKGEGFDFAELMPYIEGMDAKKIYWNSLAKGGELQLKSFYEERKVNVVTACLLSGSLRFGEPVEKYEKVLETAAFIAMSALQSGNAFQGVALSGKEEVFMPPSRSYKGIEKFLTSVSGIDPLYTKIDPKQAGEKLFQVVRKKSLLFLIGDFLELYDFKKLSRKHEVIAVIVRDRFESNPRALGETVVCDPETGEESELFFDKKVADAYLRAYHEHDKKLLNHFRTQGIGYSYIYTDERVGTNF
jgi:uncharacterized protein (DUF58 family)